MNEAPDIANHLSAVVLLSIWWAFVSVLDLLSGPHDAAGTRRRDPDLRAGETRGAEDQRFPELREADPQFREQAFLSGAASFYEKMLNAYARADIETLRPFLSQEVLRAFMKAIADRTASGTTLELTLIGVGSLSIERAGIVDGRMEIDVRIPAKIVQVVRSAEGNVVSGDPSRIDDTVDLWTFARSVPNRGSLWRLVATDTG